MIATMNTRRNSPDPRDVDGRRLSRALIDRRTGAPTPGDLYHRAEIAGMIVELRAAYGGRGVVTGRIVGCRHLRSRFHAAAVHCFTLHDLSDNQIATFLERWHALVFPHAADLGASRSERLRQTLAANPAVLDLCRNPLLLTLVALLNRGDELPRRRHKLLERATQLMIEQAAASSASSTASVGERGTVSLQ